MSYSEYIPIVFIHKGYSEYLNYTAYQAHNMNRKSPIFIIGDRNTNKFPFAESIEVVRYQKFIEEFTNKYQHLSNNDEMIERFCFERWFLLRALMEEYKLEKVFTCDSDVMLYCNITAEEKKYSSYLAAYSIPDYQGNYRLGASAHVSYWTYEGIDQFCNYITSTYAVNNFPKEIQDKWNHVINARLSGGVSDMPFLHLFAKGKNIINLSKVNDGSAFDDNINSAENFWANEYDLAGSLKKLIWKNGMPYSYNLIEGKEIVFKALHCQGPAKRLAEEYYKLNAGPFRSALIKWKFKMGKLKRKLS